MIEKIILPMKHIRITQGVNGKFSHKGTYALDLAGKDGGQDDVYAPFTGQIKRIYPNGNAIWLESLEPVKFANGLVDYCTVMMVHDDDVSNLHVGQIVKQCEVFYKEGKAGRATGNHIHLEVARGKFKGNGWFKNLFSVWMIFNAIHPKDAFFSYDNIMLDDEGYGFIKTDKPYETVFTSKPVPVLYTVAKGDTLSKISKKFGVSIEEIAKLNKIKDINKIKVGQILTIRK